MVGLLNSSAPTLKLSNAPTLKPSSPLTLKPENSLLRRLCLRIIIKTDSNPIFKIIRLLET